MLKHPEVGKLAGRFQDQIIEIDRILQFSLNGIRSQLAAPKAVEAIAKFKALKGTPMPEDEHQRSLSQAEDRARFAASQKKAGFPVLYSHAVVAIWSAIETFSEDLVVYSLLYDKNYLQKDVFRKIRILFVEYESLEKEDRMRYIVSELGRQSSAELKQGINRFEPLLDSVSLNGTISEEMRKACYELWAVRNLIVHRSGIVDRRFVQLCPWLRTKVGRKFRVTLQAYASYVKFSFNWMFEILVRDLVRSGFERNDAIAKLNPEKTNRV
jgi:hypothetical protein